MSDVTYCAYRGAKYLVLSGNLYRIHVSIDFLLDQKHMV